MKKIFIAVVLLVSIFGLALNDAQAYSLLGGKHRTTSLTYKINSSLTSTYHSSFKSAVAAWDAAVSLSFGPQVGTNRPQIVVNGKDFGNTGWNAQNTNYREFVITGDYVDSVIDANYYYMKDMTEFKRQGVFGHELGHSLGLDHVTDTSQIMCTSKDGRAVNKPGNDDIKGVNAIYK